LGRKTIRISITVVFYAFSILVFLQLIFPVSAFQNGTETLITTDIYKTLNYPPAIYGDRIAWSSQDIYDNSSSSRYIIITSLIHGYQYAIASPAGTWNSAPSIDGNILVWMQDPMDMVTYTVIAYDLAADSQLAVIPVTPGYYYDDPKNNVLPKISGTSIVWQDYSHGNWDIFYYNLTWAPGTPPQQLIAGGEDQKNPAISGNYIVYENWSGLRSSIYLYNISNSTSVRISASDNDVTPAIDGTNVVWQTPNAAGNKRIILFNLITGQTRQLTPSDLQFDEKGPKISGNYIVWEDTRERTTYSDVYHYNLADGSERWLTPGSPGGKYMPAVNGNRIVWEDARATHSGGYNNDIYLLTLGAPETCPVADFTADNLVDPPSGLVTFSDSSSSGTSPITYRLWNFSDGSAWENDPGSVTTHSHTFSRDGIYTIRLTTSNAKCRNISTLAPGHTIFINSPPVADFTISPEEGLAPLTVTFIDKSYGAPTSLSWDFGDGSPVTTGSPDVHTFSETSKEYQVALTATNGHGNSTTTKGIRTLMGAQGTAVTPINGITVDNRFRGQFLTYNASLLPIVSPNPPTGYLVSHPPADYGWQNITFLSSDRTGINKDPQENIYYANVSRIFLISKDTLATTTGSIPPIGNNWGVSYRINSTVYPAAGSLQTVTREGASDSDRAVFDDIASRVWPSGTLVRDIAYTATVTRKNIGNEGIATINMSVSEDWVKGPAASVAKGRDLTYIMGYWYDKAGNKIGGILSKRYVTTSEGVDYYEADIPESPWYQSTFALVKLSGSGNVFQLFTLSVTSRISSGGGSEGGPAVVKTTAVPETINPTLPDPGTSAMLYSNNLGVITQKTTLQSTDGLVAVTITQGVTAKDRAGEPLSSIAIKAVPAEDAPVLPQGSGETLAGTAYEIQPDGATFSPSISINFSLPQVRWGQEYRVKTFNHTSATWVDNPTTYNPETGVFTTHASHFCCFALFTRAVSPTHSAPVTTIQAPVQQKEISPPAPTALTIFSGLILWVIDKAIKNLILVAALVILAVAIFLYGRKRRRNRIM